MATSNLNKHLTFEERKIIETGIYNGSSKAAIAQTLGKDKSTIGKEIKLHRSKTIKCSLPLECAAYKKCKHGRNCTLDCPSYIPFKCSRRDRSPGACNGCSNSSKCRFDHFMYNADLANKEYKGTLSQSREGLNISEDELIRIGNIIRPLIKQGQSPYVILKNHPELNVSEKTIYNYIESLSFKNVGVDIIPLDLRRQTSRKITKKDKNKYKIRKDHSYLKDRTYKDYCAYITENPDASIVLMDTVYNDISNGPFMQTFKFLRYGFMFIVFHKTKTSQSMYEGILLLETILGKELFNKEIEVLLTDRGSEFTMADNIETREDGTIRTRIFYCDPMASGQKGSLEVMHEQIRYICPKETDLYKLGLINQEATNLMTSHINSTPYEILKGKTPLAVLEFFSPETFKKFIDFGIKKIPPDQVILKPYLLK